jgi:cysteine desulfurase
MPPRLPIYMDNHATTRTDPRVVEAMLPYFTEHYGNPASRSHSFGWRAQEAVDSAREQVAALIGAQPKEIIFTSGATESDNLAIKGAAAAYRDQGCLIITVATEHEAVLDPCKTLHAQGFRITVLPVDPQGRVAAQQIQQAITPETVLVSVMAANHEIGTLQPLADIGRVCKERKVLFHTDAAQAAGKIPLDVETMGIDLLTLSAHKMYGPKGIGALYVRRRSPHVRLQPLFDGGGQERGLRSGTLAVPNIVGFGLACQLCRENMAEEARRCLDLRERLRIGLLERLSDCRVNGHPELRLPGNLNISFVGVHGEALLTTLRNVAVSSGSACTSASIEPSHVLLALGLSEELAHGTLRFGLGRFNTLEEVDWVIEEVSRAVCQLRGLTPNPLSATV